MDSSWHTQHCIFQFLCAEGATPTDFHSQIKHVYGNNCLQHTTVSDWCKRFKEGINSIEDLACPSCPPHVMDPDTGAKVDQIVQCDHCATLWHISEHLGISVERVHHIITQVPGVMEGFCSRGNEEFKQKT